MKQILQSLKTGSVEVADVPCPAPRPGHVLVRTSRTLISAGTERMLVEFGKASMIGKARSQPDKVKQVWEKIGTDGVLSTAGAVLNKLDQPLALGYCNVGRVMSTGPDVTTFGEGERVVSNGRHAEVVSVSRNLCARVPDNVPDDAAAFTVIGAIALQGIRLAAPGLGETVVVTGLGLIGLIAVQLLRAQGCRVLGLDFAPDKLALARQFGAEVVDLSAGADPVSAALAFSRGRGVDAVLLTASTASSEPVHQAAAMCRKRGRIVLIGVTGLDLSRADFYQKELSFQVSCSYGPGRYDPAYEEDGRDYPVGFVRWTAQRNFEAVLDMMSDGRLDVAPLISHRASIDDAARAYELLGTDPAVLGVLLDYPVSGAGTDTEVRARSVALSPGRTRAKHGDVSIAVIGSGNYATAVLIPAFKASGVRLRSVVSNAGVSGLHAGRKFGFESTTTDAAAAIQDPDVDAVVVATRHESHAALACAALDAGKHVFVEKPLALTLEELGAIESSWRSSSGCILMVGFNRRFAPHVTRIKTLIDGVNERKAFVMTVNAGAMPAEHWAHDPSKGGGRVLAEACHFVDLLRYLAGSPIASHQSVAFAKGREAAAREDNVSINLRFEDGSIGTIHYLSSGHKSFPKERLEVFAAGGVLQLDNFRRLEGFGWPGFKRLNLWRQDKGQQACAAAFASAVRSGGPAPIPFDELLEVSRATIEIAGSLQ